MSRTETIDLIEGIDHDDAVVHARIAGTMLSYCGRRLDSGGSTYLPPSEVTDSAWCPDCVRIQDGL